MAGGMYGKGVCVAGRACVAGGMHGRGYAWQGGQGAYMGGGACAAGEMATEAGSTHPTGMHPCTT